MGYPILVTVRYRRDAWRCRFPNGTSATSTLCPEVAVGRLMDKTWEPGSHRAECVGRNPFGDEYTFSIAPIE